MAGFFSDTYFRIGALFFYASGAVLFYFALLSLKRVECDSQYAYVTNYFKTYRYPWDSIVEIKESKFLIFTVGQIVLKEPGALGQKMPFIASNRYYKAFWEGHPQLEYLRK